MNPITKEILLKVVYYGPGLGGKTTTLHYIHKTTHADRRGKMVSLATPVDRTLYFDFLPVELPKINDYTLRLHIFTVPGQVYFNATRKLVLNGADGVVFVADSQINRMDANIESLDNLKENLQDHGKPFGTFPLAFQYNKRDLLNISSIDDMQAQLNPDGLPWIATSALNGDGVHKSLELITKEILRDIKKRDGLVPEMKERSGVLDSKIAFSREESGINNTVANFSRTSGMAEPAATMSPLPQKKEGDSLSMLLPVAPDTARHSTQNPSTEDFSDEPPDELPSLQDNEIGHELGGLTAPGLVVPDLTDEIEEDHEEAHLEDKPDLAPLDQEDHTRPGAKATKLEELSSDSDLPDDVATPEPASENTVQRRRRDRPTIPSPPVMSSMPPQDSKDTPASQKHGSSPEQQLSFAAMWPAPQRHLSEGIERSIASGHDRQAALAIWKELERVLTTAAEGLPGVSKETVVALLGMDGRQYMEVARLAQMASSEKALSHTALLKAYIFLVHLVMTLDG
ncbi:MAG: GTPase domain-containing protein [Myxococcota bacterium]|nr:GTPase domain-containing protein [Myxococcota bacterium]